MALIKSVRGKSPVFDEKSCFMAENAVITGDVVMGRDCSVWFGAVVRGDVNSIKIGNKVNIQDGAVIHCTYEKAATTIGNNVSIGHRAIVHGCTLEDDVLIGMAAVIMDNAIIRKGAIVAAGAVVLENTIVESGCIYAGIPARKVKEVGDKSEMIRRIADNYVKYAGWYEEE